MARLLLVDDDPDQLEVRKLLLEEMGYQVEAAGNCEEAWRLFSETTPGLVVMDLRLPHIEDGLELIRRLRASEPQVRIAVLSGWPEELTGLPEEKMVDQVLAKPVRSQKLLSVIEKLAVVLLCAVALRGQSGSTHPFQLDTAAEVVVELDLSAPGADWGRAGRESVMATVTLDDAKKQQVMAFAGNERHRYRAFLGPLEPGAHSVKIERHPDYSARGIQLQVHGVTFRQYKPSDADYAVMANAPVVFARANTAGKFTDIPLLLYCERLGDGSIRYSMIFSNEDGGTNTRALMARWGRATDIEYIYQVWPDKSGKPARTLIQTRNHKDVEFVGKREGLHPLLGVVTDNNMVSDETPSAIRYQLAPVVVELNTASREKVMDENPLTYLISARELEREMKIRQFGVVEGSKISAPENYLFIEMRITVKDARLATLIRLQSENFFRSSNLGAYEMAIERSGWVRTAIELPPATQPAQVSELAFQCLPDAKAETAGSCRVESVGKMFFLNSRQMPDANLFAPRFDRGPWVIPAGHLRLVSPR